HPRGGTLRVAPAPAGQEVSTQYGTDRDSRRFRDHGGSDEADFGHAEIVRDVGAQAVEVAVDVEPDELRVHRLAEREGDAAVRLGAGRAGELEGADGRPGAQHAGVGHGDVQALDAVAGRLAVAAGGVAGGVVAV